MSDIDTTEPEVLIERRNQLAVLTLNRPRLANAQGLTFGTALIGALDQVEDDDSVCAIVLTGAGKVFCGGGKLGETMKADYVDMEEQLRAVRNAFRAVERIREIELPVVCALNGGAIGGGAALAMACDLVVAAESAFYSFPFGLLGASAVDMGCSYMLPRLVGTARARQIMLTGAQVSAQQGLIDGLFIEVVPAENVLSAAEKLAGSIVAAGSRRAVAGTKLALLRGETTEYSTVVDYELYLQCYMLNTPEHKLRVKAFVDRRKARSRAAE